MGLHQIELPASLIASLYKDHLVESTIISNHKNKIITASADENIPKQKSIQYLGKNQKGICLLVDYADDVYLPDEQLNFLTTILQACKLDLGDVAIINNHRQKISFDELRKQIKVNYLLVFGSALLPIGIDDVSFFSIQNINDCSIVYSPVAEQLNSTDPESKVLKSKLWMCLKQLFGI